MSTPNASTSSARVLIKTQVENESSEAGKVIVQTVLVGPTGSRSTGPDERMQLLAGKSTEVNQEITIGRPALWSPKTPVMYHAITRIIKDGKALDEVETAFGVRSLAWSVDKGLLLNGTAIKLAGGSVHHDNGPLGAAAFDRAEERKVRAPEGRRVQCRPHGAQPAFACLPRCLRSTGLLVLEDPHSGRIGKVTITITPASSRIGGNRMLTRW